MSLRRSSFPQRSHRPRAGAALLIALVSLCALSGVALADPPVSLRSLVSHPVLPRGQQQSAWIKISLQGRARTEERERAPLNVALVLDRSGSMSGERIAQAKRAAHQAIDLLSARDQLSLITYSRSAEVLLPSTLLTDKARAHRLVDQIQVNGNTALHAGVTLGAAEVRKALSQERVNRVILLSDGLANVGPREPAELEALGAQLGGEGMTVSTLGLGAGYNEDLMARLARSSDGNHVFIERPEQLAGFMEQEFNDALSIVAQDAMIEIRCAEGVRPLRLLGRGGEINGNIVRSRIRQITEGNERFLLLEVQVNGSQDATRTLASVQVSYQDPHKPTRSEVQGLVQSQSGTPDEVTARVNSEVMVEALDLIAMETSERAVQLRDRGRGAEAAALLEASAAQVATAAAQYASPKLRARSRQSRSEARAVRSESRQDWNRSRKRMRRSQHRSRSQQAY